MSDSSDNIYANQQQTSPFKFDTKVAAVFPDMIKRSVPGYGKTLHNIQLLASNYIKSNSRCYDLGCSLGAASLAMSFGNRGKNVEIIGVDNSSAMLERCQSHIDAFKHHTPIRLVKEDLQQLKINNASMVVLNYTLQFIPQNSRLEVIQSIFDGMNPGGLLVLSEKLEFEDHEINQLMIELHHQFKRENGYSELEISQKRNALDKVLIPETMKAHFERLDSVGFQKTACLQQQLNFATLIAIKP